MADFPTNIASDGSLLIAANNVSSTLNGGVSSGATSMTLASTLNFPSKGGVTIETEALLYTGNNTGTSVLSGLTRGADSTTAAVHADGTVVYMNMQARHHNALKDEIIAIESNISTRFGLGSTNVSISSGWVTQSVQPSFLVTNSSGGTDVTGDGTNYTLTWNNEIYDQGANFASNTFTAPVTGRYLLSVSILMTSLLTTHTGVALAMLTSNRIYYWFESSTTPYAQPFRTIHVNVIADMDANDTVTVALTVSGSTKTIDIHADAQYNYFSGSLIN